MDNYQYWARRNTLVSYVMDFFENASASLPIWILYFTRQLGFSVTAAVFLGMTRWTVMALSNLPTGAWADRYGRAKLYRFGMLIYAFSYIPFVLTKSFVLLFVTQIIGGFFGSMCQGAVAPVVRETYELAKLDDAKYTHYLSNSTIITYLARLTAGVGGAWIYVSHPYLPYELQAAVLFAAFGASWFVKDFRTYGQSTVSNSKHISTALGYAWRHRFLRSYLSAMVVVAYLSESLWTAIQPSLIYHNIKAQYFGLMFGLVSLLSALGARLSRKIIATTSGIKIKLLMALCTAVASIIFVPRNIYLLLFSLAALGLAFGFTDPVDKYSIIKYTEAKYQSTMLSFESLLYTLFFAVPSVLVGRYVDLFGTGTMLKILVGQALVGVVVVCLVFLSSKKQLLNKSSNSLHDFSKTK